MHYPPGSAYDTDPASNENLMGNRKHLTTGDIDQILDVYQCIQIPDTCLDVNNSQESARVLLYQTQTYTVFDGITSKSLLPTTQDFVPPLPCDFEDVGFPTCHWSNVGQIGWSVRSGSTPSSNTGPSAAASGSQYIYTEASGGLEEGRGLKDPLVL